MSIFGPVDDSDYRCWQQRNLKAITELITFGVKTKLPPIPWNVPTIGTVVGKVDNHADRHPREVFDAWYAALSRQQRVSPRGLGMDRDQPARSERTFPSGETRLMAGFDLRFTNQRHPHCEFVILAEWFEDEFAGKTVYPATAGTREGVTS